MQLNDIATLLKMVLGAFIRKITWFAAPNIKSFQSVYIHQSNNPLLTCQPHTTGAGLEVYQTLRS